MAETPEAMSRRQINTTPPPNAVAFLDGGPTHSAYMIDPEMDSLVAPKNRQVQNFSNRNNKALISCGGIGMLSIIAIGVRCFLLVARNIKSSNDENYG